MAAGQESSLALSPVFGSPFSLVKFDWEAQPVSEISLSVLYVCNFFFVFFFVLEGGSGAN